MIGKIASTANHHHREGPFDTAFVTNASESAGSEDAIIIVSVLQQLKNFLLKQGAKMVFIMGNLDKKIGKTLGSSINMNVSI